MQEKSESKKINVTFWQAISIILPYAWERIREQLITVLPVSLYLIFFQLALLHKTPQKAISIVAGIIAVVFGLGFFMEGVKIGLSPLGEIIGDLLPQKCSKAKLLAFAFSMGLVAAFGEPVIGSLQIAGSSVRPESSPLVYEILVRHPVYLNIIVSIGVAIAVTIGTLRFLFGWSLKPIILPIAGICVIATSIVFRHPSLSKGIGLAWDSGAVIVGPVICPLVLSLGLGIFRATGKSETSQAGFGMIGLISVTPVICTIVALSVIHLLGVPGDFETGYKTGVSSVSGLSDTIIGSLIMAIRATTPIFLYLWLFVKLVLKEKGIRPAQLLLGVSFAISGLFLLNAGVSTGLTELGNQVGNQLPSTFLPPGESIYPSTIGKIINIIFGALLGYGVTLAEPAFNILGMQVEEVTQGAFKRWLFSQAVATGVGIGAGLGILSIVYHVSFVTLLLPSYVLLLILTLTCKEEYVNIAWDGGAATTGPVTVPVVVAIAISLSHATGLAEAFGILALASAFPVINILLLGIIIRYHEIKIEKSRLEGKKYGK